jgi:NADPH-dependent F420 reductase
VGSPSAPSIAGERVPLALLGGTGSLGFGLALRLAAAGEPVLIGSRARERALAAADRIRAAVPDAAVEGLDNRDALERTERVALTIPFDGLEEFLDATRERLADKLVIDVIVPVTYGEHFFQLAPVPGAASVGELIQRRVPTARVVSAFKNLPAEALRDLAHRPEGDVLVCGDDRAARAAVARYVGLIPGLRAVDAGWLANARYLEAITALLLNLNRQYRARASIAVLGLPDRGRG